MGSARIPERLQSCHRRTSRCSLPSTTSNSPEHISTCDCSMVHAQALVVLERHCHEGQNPNSCIYLSWSDLHRCFWGGRYLLLQDLITQLSGLTSTFKVLWSLVLSLASPLRQDERELAKLLETENKIRLQLSGIDSKEPHLYGTMLQLD